MYQRPAGTVPTRPSPSPPSTPNSPSQPPSYDEALQNSPYMAHPKTPGDPRSSSTQSLVPAEVPGDSRRKLLLIYIHGFMGNETSFKSFPAHVHNLVTITLMRSHVVHTKIYPRYKSRTKVDLVAEEFSRWLAPHESPKTDIVLLGHSMGGLLSAEAILLPPNPETAGRTFRHRFVGSVNFDVPFLGMHPGVISSGISSIFKSTPEPATKSGESSTSTSNASATALERQESFGILTTVGSSNSQSSTSSVADPNFNPSFANDINLPVRKGWQSTMHFLTKHSDGLRQATKQYVKSHIEFGGAMADYRGLHARYNKIRALEDYDDDFRKKEFRASGKVPRERFVNYYTACTGRPNIKKEEKQKENGKERDGSASPGQRTLEVNEEGQEGGRRSLSDSSTRSLHTRTPSPRISVEEYRANQIIPQPLIEFPEGGLQHTDPTALPMSEDEADIAPVEHTSTMDTTTTTASSSLDLSSVNSIDTASIKLPALPPLPPTPTEPPALDLSDYPDKSVQDLLKKEHDRKIKAYKSALKDHEAAVSDRKKLEDKLLKAARKEILKDRKKEEKARADDVAGKKPAAEPGQANDAGPAHPSTAPPEPPRSPSPPAPAPAQAERSDSSPPEPKVVKEKHFCVLPPKNSAGRRDRLWVRVFMEDVDEVGAHCGLFENNPAYEALVGDVGTRIEDWVLEDATARLIAGDGS